MPTLTIPRPPVKPSRATELATMFLIERGYDAATIRASRYDASVISPADAASVARIIGQASAPAPATAERNARIGLVFTLMFGRDISTGTAGERGAAIDFADCPEGMPFGLRAAYEAATAPAPTPEPGVARFTDAELAALDARIKTMTALSDYYQAHFAGPAADAARLTAGFGFIFGPVALPALCGGAPDEVDPLEREYDDASQWPAETDADRWELTDPTDPSPEDRSWWTQWQETEASARIDRELDRLADEAETLVRLCEGLSAADPAACWTVELEGRRWMVRRAGRSMFASFDEADARDEFRHRRAGESRSRAVSGFDDFDRQRTGAV